MKESRALALSIDHPFPIGTPVRHDGRRWSLKPCAVVEVMPQYDGTYEYSVDVDEDPGSVSLV